MKKLGGVKRLRDVSERSESPGRIEVQAALQASAHYLAVASCDSLPESHRAGAREIPCPPCLMVAGDIVDGAHLNVLTIQHAQMEQQRGEKPQRLTRRRKRR